MLDEGQHAARVDGWLERYAKDLPPERQLQLLEAALGVLWARTHTTLGDVTLTAIANRVLFTAAEKFPPFSALKVEPSRGIECGQLRERLSSFPTSELRAGMRFVLVEFLTVLGNLTAELLTPELHAELSKVSVPMAGHSEKGTPEKPANAPKAEDEEKGS